MADSDSSDDEILSIRTEIKKSSVPDTRLLLLEGTHRDKLWMKNYSKLETFQKANGHCNLTATSEDTALYRWVVKQRVLQKAGTLQKAREQLLNALRFRWMANANIERRVLDTRLETTFPDKLWMENYRKLEAFQKANGHCKVPKSEDESLYAWVLMQRQFEKAGSLRNDRKQLLNDLEFSWNENNKKTPSTFQDELWMNTYHQLVDFKKKNSHLRVTCHDKALHKWVRNQKERQRTGRLLQKREQLLDELGLLWRKPKNGVNTLAAPREAVPSSINIAHMKPEAVPASNNVAHETRKKDQKFPVGTRIEKAFHADGAFQIFKGKVTAFDYIEDEDGARTWGYLIEYEDGDQEHMLEADVANSLVVEKKMKRVAKSQTNPTTSKRVKKEIAAGNDAHKKSRKSRLFA